ncbi:hypothetical protein DP144_03150 [Clostridium tetani]|uniref:PEP-utilizing enzyme n=1 Tax=Clostridium tetani TaxID=1513 RepID=UPI00100A4906|nr:PEP/pyruvate-binding domain-containing protein [Clostridium tetani]RXM78521.1 hypothetical protein DP154_03020 [Clostridium tetani]RYU99879.1 hypothetical protein DP144_03150 [Clostridium tetani]
MEISYSFGIVDLLHYGHMNTLLKAKNGSELHIFGLVSDEAALEWMGTVISNYEERKKVLENVSCIDEVIFQKTLDPLDNIKKIHKKYPDAKITVYHGDDWKILTSEEYLKSIDGQVVFTKYYEKLKPENILKALNNKSFKEKKGSNLISTKANTLIALKKRLKKSKIEDIYVVTVDEFKKNPKNTCKKIIEKFNGKKIVVRSSSSNEDTFKNSNAGHYDSVLNVDSSSIDSISNSICKVIDSYVRDYLNCKNEQILIQTQTLDVDVSGVIFTRDIHQNRPYYLINYDDNGSTDSVTSGIGGKTIWIAHDNKYVEAKWGELIKAINEIETFLEGMVLDIEFAINKKGEVIIFQVRPLAANYKFNQKNNDFQFFDLKNNEKFKYNSIINEVEGGNMMLSDMAFWNPSEIIGSNPRSLDYSLYREIITKQAWNEGLIPMGYKEINEELMYKIGNKPYISLEYSFMSLIPCDLEEDLSLKLMNFYKNKLKKDLTAHDKIEFEIVISCFDFKTDDKLKELLYNGFNFEEIKKIRNSIFSMTQSILKDYFKVLKKDTEDLNIMTKKREEIVDKLPFKQNNLFELLGYFKKLIKDIKKYGTPHFSRQARYAFISRSLCQSLVAKGYFNEEKMEEFMLSIETVASEFKKDFSLYLQQKLSREDFNNKYGHLRSGTYDIRTSPYYKMYFQSSNRKSDEVEKVYPTNILDMKIIEKALKDVELDLEAEQFIKILKKSLEQREYFKFEFTKSLSLALDILCKIGSILDIDKKLLSYLEISDILASEYYTSKKELKDFWLTIIRQRKSEYKYMSKLVLPEVIESENDFDIIRIGESRPNFITNKSIYGEVSFLEEDQNAEIEDKIIVITKADPGFDWIFAKGIKGLITKYGGVASHMAIRCAEFGIPAAIGCGEKIYNYVLGLNTINLDCKKGKITEWR